MNRHQASSLLPQQASWITVTGGKGGVGKTLVAVNLALLIARAGYRTLLVDLDPGLANVDVHMRLAPKNSLEDLVDGKCTASQAITAGPGDISILCGTSGSTRLAEGDLDFINATIETIDRSAQDYDVVICDTGAGIGRLVLSACQRADLAIAVSSPDPAAMTDTYALCKLLMIRDLAEPKLFINRVSNRENAMRTATRLNTVCQKFLQRNLDTIGWLRTDSHLEASVRDQRPLALSSNEAIMEDLRALCAQSLAELPNLRRRKKQAGRNSLQRVRQQH